jgi:hypothetical protein
MFAVTATSTAALSARVNVSVDARRPGKATARGTYRSSRPARVVFVFVFVFTRRVGAARVR